jgi:hypothetical protein
MTFQAYLDTIKAKTGKTVADFRKLAAQKKLVTYQELMTWLKSEYGLGHGHANVMALLIAKPEKFTASADTKLDKQFKGEKAKWRKPYDALAAKLVKFGPDVKLSPNNSYINLMRGSKKFGIVQVSAAERLDVGIKLKGVAPTGRFEPAGSWNIMVTHRVRVSQPKDLNTELLKWLKQAYEAA